MDELLKEMVAGRAKAFIPASQIDALMDSYKKALKEHPFPVPYQVGATVEEVIKGLKRQSHDWIGPYQNLTIFEASNRIASDLIMLEGLSHLNAMEGVVELMVLLGNIQVTGMGDFLLKTKSGAEFHGEGFSTAPSFFSGKLSGTLKKWKKESGQTPGSLSFIIFNSSAINPGRSISKGWEQIFNNGSVAIWKAEKN